MTSTTLSNIYINVIYGSETGNSEAIAERINEDINKMDNIKIKSKLSTMNSFLKDFEKLINLKTKSLIVLVCSTTGNGDPPAGSDKFIRFIKSKNLSEDSFKTISFCLLGLGDSNYSKFMYIPKIINENFLRCGATAFISKGDADDAYGLEDVVEPWIENLLSQLKKRFFNEFVECNKKILEEAQISNNNNLSSNTKINNTNTNNDKEVCENINIISTTSTVNNNNKDSSQDTLIKTYREIYDISQHKISSIKRISGEQAMKEIFQVGITNNINSTSLSSYSPGSYISVLPKLTNEKAEPLKQMIGIKDDNAETYLLNNEKKEVFKLPLNFVDDFPYFKSLYDSNNGYISKEDLILYLLDFNSIIKKINLEKFIDKLKEMDRKYSHHKTKAYTHLEELELETDKANITKYDNSNRASNKSMSVEKENNEIKDNNSSFYSSIIIYLINLKENYLKQVVSNKITFYDIFYGIYKIGISNYFENSNTNTEEANIYPINLILEFSLNEILEVITVKKPRKYSLSSEESYNRNYEFSFSVVKQNYTRKIQLDKTSNNTELIGLINNNNYAVYLGETTNYLKKLKLEEHILVLEVKNTFPFPNEHLNNKAPLIFVSNGTGVTPCLSYIKSIINKISSYDRNAINNIGKMTLISGIRSNSGSTNEAIEEDFIQLFNDKINSYDKVNENDNTNNSNFIYYSCISNVNEDDEENCGVWRGIRIGYDYVQDIINEQKLEIYDQLFNKNGSLMICGDLDKLYDEIICILVSTVKKGKNIDRSEALFLIEKLKNSGKILVEKWC